MKQGSLSCHQSDFNLSQFTDKADRLLKHLGESLQFAHFSCVPTINSLVEVGQTIETQLLHSCRHRLN